MVILDRNFNLSDSKNEFNNSGFKAVNGFGLLIRFGFLHYKMTVSLHCSISKNVTLTMVWGLTMDSGLQLVVYMSRLERKTLNGNLQKFSIIKN